MLDYEWGNPSTVMLSPDNDPDNSASDPTYHHHHHHHHHHANIFDHYANPQSSTSAFNNLIPPPPPQPPASHHPTAAFSSHFNPGQVQHLQSLYDPHPYAGASTYAPPHHHHHSLLALDPIHGAAAHGLMVVPKTEDLCHPVDFASRIGLNLGGRTYFSSEDDFMNRLYRRNRQGPDSGSTHSPRCQAEGCAADLSHAKHYHRRHKVCEFHSKASTVIANGLTQRFCQQCSRFHLLSEFDNGKRSCRKRLADHNRRRRKTQQTNNQDNPPSRQQPPETTRNSSSDNVARSPSESAAHSASSVTVAVSPPRMTLDCFRQRPYQSAATTSSGSSSSLFFSSG